jgi:hypothetical protein
MSLCDVSFRHELFRNWADPMFWQMVMNLTRNDTLDSRAAGRLNSVVPINSPWKYMSTLISSNGMFQAHIDWSPSRIEDDMQNIVAQITNKDMLIVERDHNLYQ